MDCPWNGIAGPVTSSRSCEKLRKSSEMYDRIMVAIDAAPDSPENSLERTTQFAKMNGGTVHVLHVARGHVVASDNLNAGSRLGVLDREDDVPASQQKTLQHAVDQLATPESPCTANSSTPPNSTFADLIVQRASYVQISVEPDSAEEARFQVRSGVSSHDVGTSNWPPTGTSSGHQWGLVHGHGQPRRSACRQGCGW